MGPTHIHKGNDPRTPSSTATHRLQFLDNGQIVELLTEVTATKDPEFQSRSLYEARFQLQGEGVEKKEIGYLQGYTVVKGFSRSSRRRRPHWIGAFLKAERPGDGVYTFANEEDAEPDDVVRVVQILYDDEGGANESEFRELLDQAGEFHIIADYWLIKECRGGKGYAQRTIQGYVEALRALEGGYGFEGPIAAAPGPKECYYDEESDDSKPERSWVYRKKRLIESYGKAGFEMCVAGDLELESGISVMLFDTSKGGDVASGAAVV